MRHHSFRPKRKSTAKNVRILNPVALESNQCLVSLPMMHQSKEIPQQVGRRSRDTRQSDTNPLYVFGGNVELKHICELNWNGRYMIDRSTTSVPLSLWSLVFERVNGKPSIIYEFLKGPCFAANN